MNAGSGTAGYLGRAKVRGLLFVAMVAVFQNIIMQAADKLGVGTATELYIL